MLSFSCSKCGKLYEVPDSLAGREAQCKQCGAVVKISQQGSASPDPSKMVITADPLLKPPPLPVGGMSAAPAANKIVISFDPPPKPPSEPANTTPQSAPAGKHAGTKLPMRIRRLMADAEQVIRHFRDFPTIRILKATGSPPDTYQIEYNVKGLTKRPGGEIVIRDQHLVEIQLTSEYPRQSPKCRILTPIFHPNFDPGVICIGDHWTAAEKLTDLVSRIGEMIAYQSYNVKSPLDGEAAMWADQNQTRFPIDNSDMHPPENR